MPFHVGAEVKLTMTLTHSLVDTKGRPKFCCKMAIAMLPTDHEDARNYSDRLYSLLTSRRAGFLLVHHKDEAATRNRDCAYHFEVSP